MLTLPAVPLEDDPQELAQAQAIGEQGIANGDTDWRIPYYMATNEFLYDKDDRAAAKYYDLAAQTPGIPAYAQRFLAELRYRNGSAAKDGRTLGDHQGFHQ